MSAGRRRPVPLPLQLPLLLLLLAVVVRPVVTLNCLQEGDPGEIEPRETNVRPNEKFRITCHVDPESPRAAGVTAEDLYFTRDTRDRGGSKESRSEEIKPSQSKVLNSTALQIEDSLELPVHYLYSCRVRGGREHTKRRGKTDPTLCASPVNVGYPPLDVQNFNCVSENWVNITCKWKPQPNAVQSQYRLQYLLEPSYGRDDAPPREQWALCPLYDNLDRSSCSITSKTQPVYRSGAEFYNFTMNITNDLGTRMQWLGLVNNFAVVRPAAPERVRASQITANSALLDIAIGWPMVQFPRPIEFDVTYTSPWDPQPQTVDASSLRATPGAYSVYHPEPLPVTGLTPFTQYRFSVRFRSSLARREELWSSSTKLDVRTLPLVPAAAPELDQGSFQLLSASAGSRTVLIYWRQIAGWQRNGADFSYCATARGQAGRSLLPSRSTDAYAVFEDVPESAIPFRVASCNAVGRSVQSSGLTVPAQREVGKPPHSVTLRISAPGKYQLNWQHGGGPRSPSSFTVFSCEHQPDRPFPCQGQLEMWHVSGQARHHSLSLPVGQEYQFAVSANYAADNETGEPATSSGMVWSRCSVPFSGDGDQVIQGVMVQAAQQRSVTLVWSADCASHVTADSRLVVIYCEVVGSKCQGEESRREVSRTGPSSLTLSGLRPYTRYQISLALLSGRKLGPRSIPLTVRTLQARPEPPAAVQISARSNTSLTVIWRPPARPNGPLCHYLVRVTGGRGAEGQEVTVPGNTSSATVTELRPFTGYRVTVLSCTDSWRSLGCSRPAPQVTGRTRPGAPGVMESPRTRLLNTSSVLLRWSRPRRPGGPQTQTVYVLRTISEVDGVNYTQADTEISGDQLEVTELLAHTCQPGERAQRHLFWIRAVMVLSSGDQLPGPWSEPVEQTCALTLGWPLAAVLGLVAGGLFLAVLAALTFCLYRRTKRKWLKMRDIGVNLPSGLERPEKGHGFGGGERRSGLTAVGYDRLVNQPRESPAATPASRPLLQEEDPVSVEAADISELPPSTATDSNSCSSSATNYTDSGAESEKVGSPTDDRIPWPGGTVHLAPYVQAGGPDTPPASGPVYPEFSPYVDAKAIQSLLSRGDTVSAAAEGPPAELTRSEPDLSAAAAVVAAAARGTPLPYSQAGLRASAGYVSMASDDTLAPLVTVTLPVTPVTLTTAPVSMSTPMTAVKPATKPTKQEVDRPYVALGPSPPTASAAGFPPYVLAGLAAEQGAPYTAPGQNPAIPAPAAPAAPPAPAGEGGYVTRDKLQPGGIELHDFAVLDSEAGRTSDSADPVVPPKKLPTVATVREPYCRVVTQHEAAAELGPNVSMV